MSSADLVVPKGSLVLVTGANGYLASHIVDQLLERGYRVRGTVRDASKALWLQELFERRHPGSSFELVSISDYQKPGVFDNGLKDVTDVIHTVGVISLGSDPNEIVTPTVAMVTDLLKSLSSHPTVKSFVFTSSSVAIALPNPGVVYPMGPTIFNDAAISAAWAPPPYKPENAFAVYAASKVEAEHTIRKFVNEKKPHFRTNSVLPSTTLGEILDPKNQHGSTSAFVTSLYTGEESIWSALPPQPFVNVRDVALLHIAALILPGVNEERVLGFAGKYSQTDVLAILRKLEPGKQFKSAPEGELKDVSEVDNKRSEELLKEIKNGEGWTGLEETVTQNLKHLRNHDIE